MARPECESRGARWTREAPCARFAAYQKAAASMGLQTKHHAPQCHTPGSPEALTTLHCLHKPFMSSGIRLCTLCADSTCILSLTRL